LLDYLFVAGSALCATLLIYGGWLCSHQPVDSLLDLLARQSERDPTPAPKQKKPTWNHS